MSQKIHNPKKAEKEEQREQTPKWDATNQRGLVDIHRPLPQGQ